jgi:hypothetical protein
MVVYMAGRSCSCAEPSRTPPSMTPHRSGWLAASRPGLRIRPSKLLHLSVKGRGGCLGPRAPARRQVTGRVKGAVSRFSCAMAGRRRR